MDNPGGSIFQDISVRLDNRDNRIEEEEALEDRKRRDEELGQEVANAFEDLEDGDCTVDTSDQFLSNGNPYNYNIHSGGHNNYVVNDHQSVQSVDNLLYNLKCENEALKKALESKCREVENISSSFQTLNEKNSKLGKQLMLREAEYSAECRMRKENHDLLVESKKEISELENKIRKLEEKNENLESTKNDLITKNESLQTMLSDVQQKYMLVEKNLGKNSERQNEKLLQQINERHQGKVDMMLEQINNLRDKLQSKESELKTIEARYSELQQSLINKSEMINDLAQNLEKSQRHCRELMDAKDWGEENHQLKRKVSALEKQTEDMQKTIESLRSHLETTTTELEIMDSILYENGEGRLSPLQKTFARGNVVGSTPILGGDRIVRLKQELSRSMDSQKEKRQEIRRLQEQLSAKIEENKQLKQQENLTLVEVTTLKQDKAHLESKIRGLERELHETERNNSGAGGTYGNETEELRLMKRELEECKQQLKNANKENESLRNSRISLLEEVEELRAKLKDIGSREIENRKVDKQIQDLNIDLEELKQEHNNLISNYERLLQENDSLKRRSADQNTRLELEKHKFLLQDAQSECDRLKNLYVEISNAKEALAVELESVKNSDMCKALHHAKEKGIHLERALQLAELKATELDKLLKREKIAHEEEVKQLKERAKQDLGETLKAKKNSENSCTKCIEHVAEITKFEIQILKLEDQCSEYSRETADLKDRLNEQRQVIDDFKEKLLLKENRDSLISDLKEKAQQFEEFIKCQGNSNTTSGISSPKQVDTRTQSVETSPELESNYNKRLLEIKIREELSKAFAAQMKCIEKTFHQQQEEMANENQMLLTNLKTINSELKLRQEEIQKLKYVILTEREQFQETLNKKDFEIQNVFQKQHEMLCKCRNDVHQKHDKIQQLLNELNERNMEIKSERESMRAVMNQWEEHRIKSDEKEEAWKQIVEALKMEHETTVEQLKEKYECARRTAANYKKYAEDKEKHIMQELERLKTEYHLKVKQIENRMKDLLEKKKKEMNMRVAEIEHSYEDQLNKYRTGYHTK